MLFLWVGLSFPFLLLTNIFFFLRDNKVSSESVCGQVSVVVPVFMQIRHGDE